MATDLKLSEPTEEALERIANAQWTLGNDGGTHDGVTMLSVYQHNACNHTLSGTVEVDGQTYGFIIDSGDWNGTVVQAWGDPEDVGVAPEPEPPEPRAFVPRDDDLAWKRPGMFGVYMAWRKETWLKDLERSYNYDRHFAPGGKTESYYREKAAKRGLKTGYLSDLTSAIAQWKSAAEASA